MEVVSVCKLCSGDVLGVSRQRGGSVNSRINSHRIVARFSHSALSSGEGRRQLVARSVCSSRMGFCVRGALLTQRKFIVSSNSYGPVEQKADLRYRVTLTSKCVRLSPGRNLRRLQCRSEVRLSDATVDVSGRENVSSTSGDFSPNSAETISRETNLAHVSTGSQPQRGLPVNLVTGVAVTAAVVVMTLLGFLAKPRRNGGGSMADLVRRGQVRSDRGADSELLKYEDPFNNPLVKMGNKNPIVKMCGKIFRLAPVTLTDEKVTKHQNRRIQAYRWKRPSVFLSEGDPVPEGVDPEEVRWIPSNHPFATTSNYIDEDLAQRNVYQTKGVPSRLRAEHEALRRKMEEATRREQDFQPPGMQFSGGKAWEANNSTEEETSGWSDGKDDKTKMTDSSTASDKQMNDKVGGSSSSFNGLSQGGGSVNGEKASRLRNIDFTGEVQGSGGKDQQRFDTGGSDNYSETELKKSAPELLDCFSTAKFACLILRVLSQKQPHCRVAFSRGDMKIFPRGKFCN
ncbi:hypothetical protein R1flu_006010 [Riccia fluitans]|uniref:Protein MULTIPLE CHLOROPLAST DIVISION SITE 1 n=1 Tax=Riccia fluitans TaxID=41844 RepID=A0ABD1YUT2_9MARC